ncbi:hypothetical protein EDEG_03582 [Edhazardia aedis USNM 41457]|uniref:Uncharacterized protein n=1 Tax=Edhazardia aedis (strain USNM 41457) TaxID=1003232 RepID=J9D283_EDHAE|nr:hypothetical protein EDEG_03582 [Edhazardia aedis USNM 41457]|eukprot:EJW01956.1 hypothetical protein EDEG_03582 [Edhazardia aedis USNM 41457]
MSLFRFKSRQYQLVLKESATKAVKFFSLMLNDNNKINTENLKKVLDLEQFMIEAEAYEPNPLTIFIAFKTRNNSIKLFNMYLKEKMKDLIEEQKDLPHYESEVFDDFDNIIRKMAGPFPERYNLINELAGPLVMAVFIQEKCNIQ